MKKQVLALTAMAGLALGAASAQAVDSTGKGIVGSVHDLSTRNTVIGNYASGSQEVRICAFCHSPHHSLQTNVNGATNTNDLSAAVAYLTSDAGGQGQLPGTYNVYAPLWSRTDLSSVGGYGTYLSQTFNPNASSHPYDPLIGPSRLCLSCHDGAIAIDDYYGNKNATTNATHDNFNGPSGGGDQISIGIANKNEGGLMNDHPIGMNFNDYYKQQRPDTSSYELMSPDTHFQKTDGSQSAKTVNSVLYRDPTFSGLGSTTSGDGFVTCASCHDVHNGTAVGNNTPSGTQTRGFLLYGSQVQSSFCLTCHDKNNTQPPPPGN